MQTRVWIKTSDLIAFRKCCGQLALKITIANKWDLLVVPEWGLKAKGSFDIFDSPLCLWNKPARGLSFASLP